MQNQIVQALKNSLIGNTSTLQQSNEKLSEMSKIEGYCVSLMKIIDESTLQIAIKQAALIQLKNNIKMKWKSKTQNQQLQLTANQKNLIRNSLVMAVIRCAKNHMLIKLYRQILTIVISYQYQTWIPMYDLINILKSNENLSPTFHCILGICTNFQFSVMQKQRTVYNQFLKQILPAVLATVKNNINNAQLIYLGLKILYKSVHYEVSPQIKVLTNDWMPLLLLTIQGYNEDIQKKLDEIQTKNTPQFYYYHSKKWATRILMRYVTKHAKSTQLGKVNNENIQYSNDWYEKYGLKLCESIVIHLSTPIPTTKKIRYFQLKIIQGIINDKPDLISQHSKAFQYQILIKYMTLTAEDENLAKQDVVQYLRIDDEAGLNFTNIKGVATQVWNNFLQMGSRIDRDHNVYHPGPLFQENIEFMYSKIASENLIQKQLGMYLFCQNRMTINRVPLVRQKMPQIVQKYVIPQLSNPAMMIRAKANDMLYQYGKQITDFSICQKALQGMFNCLTKDESPLVKIKAAIALNPLISHKQSKQILKDCLKQILQVYLKLIEQYDLEQIVSALQYFISDFADSIGPYAIDLFRYLFGIFIKMFNKDAEQTNQNQQYGSEIQLAASGCIKTMTQIIESPLQPQIRSQIQTFVLDLCAFLFVNESYDYFQDMMYLLRVHIYKADKISQPLWFFYQVVIYFICGIPKQMCNQIENLEIPEQSKKILSSVKRGNNFQYLEHAVPVIRNYLGKGHDMVLAQKNQFKVNLVHLIFYLVSTVYKKSNPKQYEGQIHYDCCSILIAYLLQTFPSQMTEQVVVSVWNIIKFNSIKLKSIYIKQISCQLMAILLWKHTQKFLQLLNKENQLKFMFGQFKKIGSHLQQSQERKRMILGICSYLLIVQKQFDILGPECPNLFKILLKLVRKNCRNRIIFNTNDPNIKKELIDMSQDESDNNQQNEEDDQDLWDQEYTQNHTSYLRKINQLLYFKQTIEKLRNENHKIYPVIINSSSPEALQLVNNMLEKAINLVER